ncbi:hypothetical protein LCGC14_2369760 [marine sediment metagenome]|uniref:Uncharacterized protein n=1 Tax=marine sediment metagenome TaxID=412755 RepID=A0A0F9C463_9ZZZZ
MSINGVANIRCPECGSPKFTIVHRDYTIADFSKEGAIEDHPFISNGGRTYSSIICDNCAEPIEGELEREILKEVI